MNIKVPDEALYIINTLESNGYEAFAVGGCVRDSLLGTEPKDWDICTPALPGQTAEMFRQFRVVETGLKHGTLTLVISGRPFEVTTYRADGVYSDGRRPDDVEFVKTIKEDLSRRDFTINAIAFSPKRGTADFFGGLNDLRDGVIKCVGDPGERFREDALRIMRALRFASALGFSIDGDTSRAMHDCRGLLKNISAERIAAEMNGLVAGKNAGAVMTEHLQVLAEVIPELAAARILKGFDDAPVDTALRLAVLFLYIPQISADTARGILSRLKYDNGTIEAVTQLILYSGTDIRPQAGDVKRLLGDIGEKRLRQLIELKRAGLAGAVTLTDEIIGQKQCFSLKDMAVGGRDLIGIGIPEGAELGAVLNRLLGMVIDGQVENDGASLLEAAKHVIINGEK